MGTAKLKKDETLHIRLVQEDKNLIEEAAKFQGLSSSSFMLQNALAAARKTLEQETKISLSLRDSAFFLEAIEKPSRPNAALVKAFDLYQKRVRRS